MTTIIIGGAIALISLGLILLQLRGQKKSTVKTLQKNPGSVRPKKELQKFTRAQVATHNKESDAWIIVDGRVYDITEYDIHPGKLYVTYQSTL